VADALVFKKWREAVGGNIRAFISGGAPLAPEIAYMFYGAGLLILQGYGLTETSPSISCNTEERNRIGTVGPVMDRVNVKIAEDGEILVGGAGSGWGSTGLDVQEERRQTLALQPASEPTRQPL
jgi:long-chain acyl-CoA synthetase